MGDQDQELEALDLVPQHFLLLVATEQDRQTAPVVLPSGPPRLWEVRRPRSTSGHGRLAITEIINHPDYNSATVDNDFALLRMADRINWAANPNIRPACLPEYTAGDYDQWMSTVTGWGTTSSGGATSNILLEVDVQVISNSECNGAYSGGITDNMLCAADASGNGGSDACQGDSGGPLVSCGADGNCGTTPGQNYELIGVV